ncbi:MAG: AraC family transcriptional regulator [Alphaproteobacteria bacterium]|nr:AraC family transcriptional regulator [Alphaproteobacteria bacterium]
MRTEQIRQARSWSDVTANHTVVVNLGGLITHFEVELEDGTRSVQPPTSGYMSIVPAGQAFSGTFQGRTTSYAVWEMPPNVLQRIADEAGLSGAATIVPRLSHRDEVISDAIGQLVELVDDPDNLSDLLGDTLNRTLGLHLLTDYGVGADRQPARVAREILSRTATKALQEYINAQLSEKITLEDLAGIAGQSVHNLLIGFRQRFKKTPYQYVIEQRLKRARWELANTSKPISAVAYDVGFSSQSHLTSAFQKSFRVSPRAFRKSSV